MQQIMANNKMCYKCYQSAENMLRYIAKKM